MYIILMFFVLSGGPMMILEYCSKGVLKDFLEAIRSNITIDVEERLCRITFAICNGMDYLASKKVFRCTMYMLLT